MDGPQHGVTGWYCGDCGWVDTRSVVPAFVMDTAANGQLAPCLRLAAQDGHAEIVILGWENLRVLVDQGRALLAIGP